MATLAYIGVDGRTYRQLIGVRAIQITRAEGPTKLVGRTYHASSWIEVNNHLSIGAATAPTDGSYHKHDFRVTFEDGQTYSGRYDLEHWNVRRPDLAAHVLAMVRYYAGEAPAWMADKPHALASYQAEIRSEPERTENAKTWLVTYDLNQPPVEVGADEDVQIVADYRKKEGPR